MPHTNTNLLIALQALTKRVDALEGGGQKEAKKAEAPAEKEAPKVAKK